MSQVEPCFKDNLGDCGCGDDKCSAFGRLKKPNKDGTRCVARICKCARCRNRNNNKRGHDRQSQGVKRTRAFVAKFMPSNEESLSLPFRYEHKDGTKARTVVTAYERERAQSDASKSIGDPRGFVAGYSLTGRRTYYVIRDDELEPVVVALAEAWGFIQ